MLETFYVELTPASMNAAHEALKQVAGTWKSGQNKAPPKIRRRRLVFKATAKVVKKKIKEQKKGLGARAIKPTGGKVLKPGKAPIECVPENFSRSARGEKLIQEQLTSLRDLDRNRHPKKPCFEEHSGLCRLQLLVLFNSIYVSKTVDHNRPIQFQWV